MAQTLINWADCQVLESVPGKLGGAWVFRGTRVPYTTVLDNISGMSVSEIADSFPTLRRDQIVPFLSSSHAVRSRKPKVPKRVLLDENLSHKLRLHLEGNVVFSSAYQGWAGKLNGELVALAQAAGFEVMVTADQNLSYQQNMKSRKLALVVLSSKREKTVLASGGRILAAINEAEPSS